MLTNLRQAKDFFESCVALVFLFVWTLIAPFLAFLFVIMAVSGAIYDPHNDPTMWLKCLPMLLPLILTVGIAFLVIKAAASAMGDGRQSFRLSSGEDGKVNQPTPKAEEDSPLPIRIALALPRMPLIVAIPIALWWTAHGLYVNVLSLAYQGDYAWIEKLGIHHSQHTGPPMPWAIGMLVSATLAMDIADAIFLFMAIGCVYPSETLLKRLWAIRYWFCLAIATASWLPSILNMIG